MIEEWTGTEHCSLISGLVQMHAYIFVILNHYSQDNCRENFTLTMVYQMYLLDKLHFIDNQ